MRINDRAVKLQALRSSVVSALSIPHCPKGSNMYSILLRNFICLICLSALISCAGPSEVGIQQDTLYETPMPRIEYEYELGPGDVIEIIYHFTPKPDTGEYYLSVGDVIRVEFDYHGNYDRTLTIRPDGYVTMPRKGDVYVLGLTPGQLQKKLVELFRNDFKDPVITITMEKYNTAIEHLKKAITTAPRGQSKLTTIRPDGYVSFPMLQDFMARGKTIPLLKEQIAKEYNKIIDNLTISLVLWEMKANLIYIMGEVAKPDCYLMEGPSTVTQMLARAGGLMDTAEKSTILVISRDAQRRPCGRLVNLDKILSAGDISQDLLMRQYDIVYVPKTAIARRNLFVEQYINKMIPSFFNADYSVGGTLVDHAPLIK